MQTNSVHQFNFIKQLLCIANLMKMLVFGKIRSLNTIWNKFFVEFFKFNQCNCGNTLINMIART